MEISKILMELDNRVRTNTLMIGGIIVTLIFVLALGLMLYIGATT